MKTLRAAIRALAFILLTLPLMPVQWLFVKLRTPQARTFPHWYHRQVCKILGLTLHVDGTIKGNGLIVANHTSWADIPVLSAIHPVSFIAKQEVSSWPFFGALARLQRTVFVDRDRRTTTGASAQEMLARLKAGDTLVLFPEGTSHHGRGLKPFKSAFFSAVENSDIPVIPVTVSYSHLHGLPNTMRQSHLMSWIGDTGLIPHLWDFLKAGPITVKVTIHAPLEPTGRKVLATTAREVILAAKSASPAP